LHIPPEAADGLASLRSAEVGVYRVPRGATASERQAVLTRADAAMTTRGWCRLVGVSNRDGVVAVYLPTKGTGASSVRCCLLVLQKEDFVVARVRGNPQPLLEILSKKAFANGALNWR